VRDTICLLISKMVTAAGKRTKQTQSKKQPKNKNKRKKGLEKKKKKKTIKTVTLRPGSTTGKRYIPKGIKVKIEPFNHLNGIHFGGQTHVSKRGWNLNDQKLERVKIVAPGGGDRVIF